jgi:hypothetical protein
MIAPEATVPSRPGLHFAALVLALDDLIHIGAAALGVHELAVFFWWDAEILEVLPVRR